MNGARASLASSVGPALVAGFSELPSKAGYKPRPHDPPRGCSSARRARSTRGAPVNGARTLALCMGLMGTSACLFAPSVAPHGYNACTSDADCEAGRTCDDGDGGAKVCAPPPWHDEAFGDRRVIVVTNEDSAPMPVGTAVPVIIGGDGDRRGLLALDEVPVDFRFSDFDPLTATWSVRSVFLDLEDDRFTAWIPLAREVPQGKSDALAWLESDTFEGVRTVVEDAESTFALFESFDAELNGAGEPEWILRGTGGGPRVSEGNVNVGDNQSLVLATPLSPPVQVTALARVNGVNCTEVFIGFTGDEDAAFALPPAAGLFIDQVGNDLAGVARIGPVPVDDGGQLEDRGGVDIGGALMRVTVNLDGPGVRVLVDEAVVLDEGALVPAFPADPVYFAVHVGGACSLDIDTLWITPLPLPPPSVTVGPLVELSL